MTYLATTSDDTAAITEIYFCLLAALVVTVLARR